MHESSILVDPSRTKLYYILMTGVLLLLLWPVWEFQYPSMVDYPDHLARLRILRDWDHLPLLQERYEIVRRPLPNVAVELLGVYVFPWLDVPQAGKAILTVLVILFWAGCHFLGCVAGNGRPAWTSAIAALLLYNSAFLLGFVNYNFSIALFLLALATWLWYRRKRSLARMLAVVALATFTYLAHLMGIGVLAVSMIFIVAVEAWRAKNWSYVLWADLIPLLFPVLLYASLGGQRGDTHTILWGTLLAKAKHLVVWITAYNLPLSVAYFAALLVALAILLYKGQRWSASICLKLGGFLLVLAVVFPAEQLFAGSDADARLVIPAMAVTLVSLGVAMPRFWARATFLLALAVMCFRVCEIRYYWIQGDALTREQLALFRPVPFGASVFPVFMLPADVVDAKRERHLLHAVEYATVEKLIFFPQLIGVVGQQPVLARGGPHPGIAPKPPGDAPNEGIPASGRAFESVPWNAIFDAYDYVYVYGVNDGLHQYLEDHCERVSYSGRGWLYRIRKQSTSSKTSLSADQLRPASLNPRRRTGENWRC